MKKALAALNNIEKNMLFVLLSAMTIIIGIQVFARFIIQDSLSWSEEIARYLLVWVTFIGASLGVKEKAHIGVEAITLKLPKRVKKIVNIIAIICCLLFCVIIIKESLEIIQTQLTMNQISPAVQIPMWIPYAALPVGSVLMTIRFIESVIKINRKIEDATKAEIVQSEGGIIQ